MQFSPWAAVARAIMGTVRRGRKAEARVLERVPRKQCLWVEPGSSGLDACNCGEPEFTRGVCLKHKNRAFYLLDCEQLENGEDGRIALEARFWKAGILLQPGESARIRRCQRLAAV